MAEFLIVDDNRSATDTLCALVARRGHRVRAAYDGRQALKILEEAPIDILVTDLVMPEIDGMRILRTTRERWPDVVTIVVTAHGSIEIAVEAMKTGAFDFVTKPLEPDEFQVKIQKAAAHRDLTRNMERLRARVDSFEADNALRHGSDEMLGESDAIRRVFESIEKVAPTDSTVLILGESGTGKELVARAIRKRSERAQAPFVSVHCASYAEGILESELFGHEKGSFTGATGRKIGRFELADKGTFFLDEVGEIPMGIQTKLLRVIQERRFERVGGTQTIDTDIRIVSATNKDLTAAMQKGEFREDLFYRLNIFTIELPALRERKSDLPLLIQSFVAGESARLGRRVTGPTPAALNAMLDYDWPGNIRELKNIVERAAILAGSEPIDLPHLPPMLGASGGSFVSLPEEDVNFDREMEAYEKRLILHAYERSGRVKAQAAKMLGIDRNRFRYKLEKYGITD